MTCPHAKTIMDGCAIEATVCKAVADKAAPEYLGGHKRCEDAVRDGQCVRKENQCSYR
jgi:hypothetical protein